MDQIITVVVMIAVAIWPVWLFLFLFWKSRIAEKRRIEEEERRKLQEKNLQIEKLKKIYHYPSGPIIINNTINLFESKIDAMEFLEEQYKNGRIEINSPKVIIPIHEGRDYVDGLFLVVKAPAPESVALEMTEVFTKLDTDTIHHAIGVKVERQRPSSLSKRVRQILLEQQRRKLIDKARRNVQELIEESDEVTRPYVGAVAVYVIRSNKSVKVGISADPAARLGGVQTGHPIPLNIEAAYWLPNRQDAAIVEKMVHSQLQIDAHHSHGEWFSCSVNTAKQRIEQAIYTLARDKKINVPFDEKPEKLLFDSELEAAQKVVTGWRRSKKGNWTIRAGGHRVTVFKTRRGNWGYVVNGAFGKNEFLKLTDARRAALKALGGVLKSESK